MLNIDKIYVINKKDNFVSRELCETQLLKNGLYEYIFIDAIYPSEHYNLIVAYNEICKNMDDNFIKNNFSIGAFGCLLSHIKVVKHALENNFENILILENDFIIVNDFITKFQEYKLFIKNNNINWDFIYLGKKQGYFNKYDIIQTIHNDSNFIDTKDVNEYLYVPNYQTWGTHAILIKSTLFQDIINFESNIIAPIDIMLMSLYNKYKFFAFKNDLFITDETQSDIKVKHNNWNWDINNYIKINKTKIENIVVLGYTVCRHTHHYIHKMYYTFFTYYYPNIKIYWEEDFKNIENNINIEKTMVFISPCHTNRCFYLPEKAYYIIHLDSVDNNDMSNEELNKFFIDNKHIYNDNKYIILTCRKGLYGLNYFDLSYDNKAICLPWFSETMYNEVNFIKNNLEDIYYKNLKKPYFCYFGTMWNFNISIILELIDVFSKKKDHNLLLKGRLYALTEEQEDYIRTINTRFQNIMFEPFNYFTDMNYKNSFTYIDENFGIKGLLPLQGKDHDNKYISNRIFETLSFGHLVITNCKLVKETFKSAVYNQDITALINEYIDILNNKDQWVKLMHEQLEEFIYRYYGYNNIKNLLYVLKFICKNNYDFIYYDDITEKKYVLWIKDCNNYSSNKYFKTINNNTELLEAIREPDNYILNYKKNIYDIFLIDRIIQNKNFRLYIDNNDELINCEILSKILKNTEFEIKNKLDIYCIISGQRTGSTIIIDILQKTQNDIFALSEIFYNYFGVQTYTLSFDVKDGILKEEKIFKFDGLNINEYFQQFIDMAEFKNCKKFVFKLTLDFMFNKKNFVFLEEIIHFISSKNINIIYINRNDLKSYISRKLADIYGFSNIEYNFLPDEIFNLREFYNFMNNKSEYEYLIQKNLKINKYIYYSENENIETIIEKINNVLDINLDNNFIKYKNYVKFNTKQNNFSNEILFDKKYWS